MPMLCVLGAVVAKKKMMKKYGWYKHSEDGGKWIRAICIL